jgi:hypothetical protein
VNEQNTPNHPNLTKSLTLSTLAHASLSVVIFIASFSTLASYQDKKAQ